MFLLVYLLYEIMKCLSCFQELLQLAEQLGDARQKGLTKAQINILPTKKFQKSSVKEGESIPECHVCMCEYEENDKLRILPCFHNFHADCIDKWIKVSEFQVNIK